MKSRGWWIVLVACSLSAQTISFSKRVPVEESLEVTHTVTKRVPYKKCWEEEVQEEGSDTVGALIGGAAGGIIGHQVGRGSGKTAATVGGAIIGTLVGKNLAEKGDTTTRLVRKCRTVYEERQERIVRYKNIAYVMGRRIERFSDQPIDSILVRIRIDY